VARLARAEIFDPSEIVAVYLIGKTVRSCFLMGSQSDSSCVAYHGSGQVAPRIFERLGIEPLTWEMMVKDFGRAFKNVAATAKSVSEVRSLKTHRKFYRARV
jgi:hypothetical protein